MLESNNNDAWAIMILTKYKHRLDTNTDSSLTVWEQ